MGIGKEELSVFEKYERLQERIFNDACDVGVIATKKIKDELHAAIVGLKGLDRHYTQTINRDKKGLAFNCKGQILIETSDNYPGKHCGYKIKVGYYEIRHQGKPLNFFSITTQYSQSLKS